MSNENGPDVAKADAALSPPQRAGRIGQRANRLLRLTAFGLAGVAAVLLPVVAGGLWSGWIPVGNTPTTGAILVDGPQVYTRERLVNDRYREDSWLRSELEEAGKASFGVRAYLEQKLTMDSSVSGRAGVRRDLSTAPSSVPPSPGTDDHAPEPLVIPLTPMDLLQDKRVYREKIRDLMIENQLDDRHDLRGNSLYRLKFNASIMPGDNTSASGRVSVSIRGPNELFSPAAAQDSKSDKSDKREHLSSLTSMVSLNELSRAAWTDLYNEWLVSLENRFEQARVELTTAYKENRFTADDYEDFIRDIRIFAALPDEAPNAKTEKAYKEYYAKYYEPDLDPSQLRQNGAHETYKKLINGMIAQWKATQAHIVKAARQSGKPPAWPDADYTDPKFKHLNASPSYSEATGDKADSEILRTMLDHYLERRIHGLVLGTLSSSYNDLSSSPVSRYVSFERDHGKLGHAYLFRPLVMPLFFWTTGKPPTGLQIKAVDRSLGGTTFSLSAYDLMAIKQKCPDYDYNVDLELQQFVGKNGVFVLPVNVGLVNFIRAAGSRVNVYSYAVTPSETVQRVANRFQHSRSERLALTGDVSASDVRAASGFSGQRTDRGSLQDIAAQSLVVGFGNQSAQAKADFGWFIGPQEMELGADGRTERRQRPSQHPLTALISLPAWWKQIEITVHREWIDGTGRPVADDSKLNGDRTYMVDLPVDFDTLEAALLSATERGPEVQEVKVGRLSIWACSSASIVIPGRRLWRSAVVTLGGQQADGIYVLPDMKGIIAQFNQVQLPDGWSEDFKAQARVPVTVWTSRGSATLKRLATVSVPESLRSAVATARRCPDDPRKVLDDKATARVISGG